ncbi:DNA cytosine methyltransferase, partial [Escherichia coli]
VLGDIANINSSDIPNCDVVVGGFPCQGFSVANMNRKSEDPRNKLYLEMVRIIRDKRPAYFIAENVKGILSLDKGLVIQKITSDFESLGYNVKYSLLNCAD